MGGGERVLPSFYFACKGVSCPDVVVLACAAS